MKDCLSIILLGFTTISHATPEAELNNWLDSTFNAYEIDWQKAHNEFTLYTQDHYKEAENVAEFLIQFKPVKRSESQNAYKLESSESYPKFKELAEHAKPVLRALEKFTLHLILKYDLESYQNAYTRFLLHINHFNHLPLNYADPIEMRSKLFKLKGFFSLNPKNFEKIGLTLLSKKIFLENSYISTDDLIASIDNWETKDSLQIDTDTNVVQRDPLFIGGDANMSDFVQLNINYPHLAREMGESGIVYVQFAINRVGKVINVRIRKGVSDSIDKEAIRLLKMMPPWIPGIHHGKLVTVNFTLPLTFGLH